MKPKRIMTDADFDSLLLNSGSLAEGWQNWPTQSPLFI